MGFTRKTKTVGLLQRLNTRVVKEADFKTLLNNDTTLQALNQSWVAILGSVKADTIAGATGNIQKPDPFPCPQSRWLGSLSFDSTDDTHVNTAGKKDYPYKHAVQATANAAAFRDRTIDLIEYYSMQDDAINADTSFNRGGVAGAAIGVA